MHYSCKKEEDDIYKYHPIIFNDDVTYYEFTDQRDGQTYKYVKIDTQYWMAQNLNYYVDTGCWDYSSVSWYRSICGLCYDWKTADKVCPDGWHLPSYEEWGYLEIALGMSEQEVGFTGWKGTDEGGKLKEIGTKHWKNPNSGATNESGFTALPCGVSGFSSDDFARFGIGSYYWSSYCILEMVITKVHFVLLY